MRHIRFWLVISAVGAVAFIFANSIQVSATNVTIDENLTVSPGVISFETTFPGDVRFQPLDISLSSTFLRTVNKDDVEYKIIQKPKPRKDTSWNRAYCKKNPLDYSKCYPSLCPYLSKEPDGAPANDTGVPAFHDPNASTSIAYGRLAKSDHDTEDHWTIDLHTPCFRGECDQANTISYAYQLDPKLHGQTFGCDLVVEITKISYTNKWCGAKDTPKTRR